MPMMHATTTAMIIAASVLISGASADASGSTAVDADDAAPTVTYVVADEIP